MHTHRVEVFNGADDDAVVIFVSDNLHLVFFPANQRLINEQLAGWRELEAAKTDFLELIAVIGDAATRAAHRE